MQTQDNNVPLAPVVTDNDGSETTRRPWQISINPFKHKELIDFVEAQVDKRKGFSLADILREMLYLAKEEMEKLDA